MPSPALRISCQRTIEEAERLSSWLKRRSSVARLANAGVRDGIAGAVAELKQLLVSIDASPGIGIVGASDAARADLVTALLSADGRAGRVTIGQRRVGLGTIGPILFCGEAGGAGLVLRFAAEQSHEADGGTQAFPIRVRLLGQADLARIIASLYFTHIPGAATKRLDGQDLRRSMVAAREQLSVNAVPGLTASDIVALREHMVAQMPRSPALKLLAATGYWDFLEEHVAYLSEAGRRDMLAILWRREPRLCWLFGILSDALAKLGNAGSIACPPEALVASDRTSGWVVRHPASIVANATLARLGRDGASASGSGDQLRVSTGRHQPIEVSRDVLAALAAEITFEVEGSELSALTPAEFVAFPNIVELDDVTPRLVREADPAHGIPADLAVRLFAHAKASYLFARACTRGEVTSLIGYVDVAGHDDDVHAATIAEWIDIAQGQDARGRERVETGLAVVASGDTRADGLFPPDAQGIRDHEAYVAVAERIGSGSQWVREWTTGRPFSRIHRLLRGGDQQPTPAELAAPGILSLPGETGATGTGFRAEGERGGRLPPANLGSVAARVIADIAAASTPTVKARQIRHQIGDSHRALRSRLLRHHGSNDPARIADWRLQIAHVAQNRLEAAVEARTLAQIWLALQPSEAELEMLIAMLAEGAVPGSGSDGAARPATDDAELPSAQRIATAVGSYWIRQMYEATRSGRVCRQVGIAQPVLQHIVDELAIGAMRQDLNGELARRFKAVARSDGPRRLVPLRLAAVAVRLIGAYLETLAVDIGPDSERSGDTGSGGAKWERVSAEPAAGGGQGQGQGYPGAAVDGNAALALAERTVVQRQAGAHGATTARAHPPLSWPAAYLRLVEHNIAAASSITAHAELDRELGEHLSVFTSSAFEVEL